MRNPFNGIANDPARAGTLAAGKLLLGELSRYAAAPVHTEGESLAWHEWDAETPGEERCRETGWFEPALIKVAAASRRRWKALASRPAVNREGSVRREEV